MLHSSDTPANGDFAAYVERLTSPKTGTAMRENLFAPKEGASATTSFAASSGLPSVKTALEPSALAPLKKIPFLRHVKWLVVVWIATQLLAKFVHGIAFLFISALLLYAAWVIFTVKGKNQGDLFKNLKALAARAAEEGRKVRSSQQKNRP